MLIKLLQHAVNEDTIDYIPVLVSQYNLNLPGESGTATDPAVLAFDGVSSSLIAIGSRTTHTRTGHISGPLCLLSTHVRRGRPQFPAAQIVAAS